jgi:hypothetical protein
MSNDRQIQHEAGINVMQPGISSGWRMEIKQVERSNEFCRPTSCFNYSSALVALFYIYKFLNNGLNETVPGAIDRLSLVLQAVKTIVALASYQPNQRPMMHYSKTRTIKNRNITILKISMYKQ